MHPRGSQGGAAATGVGDRPWQRPRTSGWMTGRRFRSKRAGKAPAPIGWMAPGRQDAGAGREHQEDRRRRSPPEGQGDEGGSSEDNKCP
ncbi:MAG: hypothetical protein E4G89_03280 [Methanothrix sp.]|nr:MAG: hypothetical protein E4G89_03280 [Methanothrix sp.]